jgi:hypothetical protein
MTRIGSLLEKLTFKYFNWQLDRGNHARVHSVSHYWGGRGLRRFSDPFYSASWSIQGRLIKEFKYWECPHCMWAFETDSHLKESEYCSEVEKRENEEDERIWHEIREAEEWYRKDNEYPD